MNAAELEELARSIAGLLAAGAAHGLGTSSLHGIGEITFRDGIVVAVASVGSRLRQAWIIKREQVPAGWKDTPIDVVVAKKSKGAERWLVGVELKWWRQDDGSNAGNRRSALIRDFLRCAALYQDVEDGAFIAMVSTNGSWVRTTSTSGSDARLGAALTRRGESKWDVATLSSCAGMKAAVNSLREKSVPIVSAFSSRLFAETAVCENGKEQVVARVWEVRKHQNSRILISSELESSFGKLKTAKSADVDQTT